MNQFCFALALYTLHYQGEIKPCAATHATLLNVVWCLKYRLNFLVSLYNILCQYSCPLPAILPSTIVCALTERTCFCGTGVFLFFADLLRSLVIFDISLFEEEGHIQRSLDQIFLFCRSRQSSEQQELLDLIFCKHFQNFIVSWGLTREEGNCNSTLFQIHFFTNT